MRQRIQTTEMLKIEKYFKSAIYVNWKIYTKKGGRYCIENCIESFIKLETFLLLIFVLDSLYISSFKNDS